MGKRILVIDGHPDPRPERLCSALADAYAAGAEAAGHEVRRIDVGRLEFPLIRDADTFIKDAPPPTIAEAQDAVRWCEHLVVIHPLWLGSAPAVLKGFFEQVFRYGFALKAGGRGVGGLLQGRSARVVATMGMPGFIFRTVFGGFGVRAFERGILRLSGFAPVRLSYFGGVGALSPSQGAALRERMRRLGRAAR